MEAMMQPHTVRRTGNRGTTGFTLIELMITVAIVAILAALAYPSYRNYVLRSQLVDATNGLAALQANMERYFQDNRTYAPIGAANPPCATVSTIGAFTLSCPVVPTPPGTTYALQATGSGTTAGFVFTVDQANIKTTTATASGWVPFCAIAWETKEGQC
jgi:prepilin-type N-terminal cleavage/methylation domain-containing protein